MPLRSNTFVRDLTPGQIRHHGRLRIRGTVTYYDSNDHLLFVQDETAGLFVKPDGPLPISEGSIVEVEGQPVSDFTNILESPAVRELGRGPLPKPKFAPFSEIARGHEDCNLVSLTGIIRSVSLTRNASEDLMVLRLATPNGEIEAHIQRFGSLRPEEIIDARVRVHAVAGAFFNDLSQFVAPLLRIPGRQAIEILKPPPSEQFDAPFRPMDELLRSRTSSDGDHRVSVHGTVTLSDGGNQLAIQNGPNSMLVHLSAPASARVGDVIEAVGFPAVGDFRPSLEYAAFRVLQSGPEPKADTIDLNAALSGKYGYRLVSMQAQLLGVVRESGKITLNLSASGRPFSAAYPMPKSGKLSDPAIGSLVRVTGVCMVQPGGLWKEPQGFNLVLRSKDDVVLLASPPWWTTEHLTRVIAGCAVLLALIFGWVSALRKRVHVQDAQLRRAALLQEDRNRVLEMISSFKPSDAIITGVKELLQNQWDGALCSVSLADRSPVDAAARLIRPEGHWVRPVVLAGGEEIGGIAVTPGAKSRNEDSASVLDIASSLLSLHFEHRSLHNRLAYSSQHDTLTGLANRDLFDIRLLEAIDRAQKSDGALIVAFIDLDNFKQVNDEHDHRMGDNFLREVARNLESALGEGDTLARWGGDEFILLSPHAAFDAQSVPDAAAALGARILEGLNSPFYLSGTRFVPSASVGIAIYPEHDVSPDGLRQKADQAMYTAKISGRDQVRLYCPADVSVAEKHLMAASHLKEALQRNYFRLLYQPQFTISGELTGFEALIRLNHPEHGLISPTAFIGSAERSRMIVPIGNWVLREACRQAHQWVAAACRPLRIAVNVSAVQFGEPNFADSVLEILSETGLPPQMLELELTETALVKDVSSSIHQMNQLRAKGVRFAIDDFGNGYSSLAYLHTLPIDTIKIDRSFIQGLHRSPSSLPVLKTIMSLAAGLGTDTVAEGVEDTADIAILRELGCHFLQGFGLSRPLPKDAITAQLPGWLDSGGLVNSNLTRLSAGIERTADPLKRRRFGKPVPVT